MKSCKLCAVYFLYVSCLLNGPTEGSVLRSGNIRKGRHTCESKGRIDIESESGVQLEALNNSRVFIDDLTEAFQDGHSLRFEFKTTSPNGTLFYISRRHDQYDMVSGGIHNGLLHFKIRCKSSYADLTLPKYRVDDGVWHKIKFQRRNRKGMILLDDVEYFDQYYVGCDGFTSVNFGSTNPDHESSASVQELMPKNGQLKACLRKFHISTNIAAPPYYSAVSVCN